ncbi:MAG: hypothetical protein KDA61_11430 [Planctomycetales bacterium]|nr:hypothetical protein [Planctomycetales bacterium]
MSQACDLGRRYFGLTNDETPSREGVVHSTSDDWEAATAALQSARAPLVWGMASHGVDVARAATALADRTRGYCDVAGPAARGAEMRAFQEAGLSTATLGEVANRADLVVFWDCALARDAPRFWERFVELRSPPPAWGSPTRRTAAIVVGHDAEPTDVECVVRVEPEGRVALLAALRAEITGKPWRGDAIGGVAREQVGELAQTLRSARYGAMLWGGAPSCAADAFAERDAMTRLIRELNGERRFVGRGLAAPAGAAAAENALCWQTGFPLAVSFTRGFPRYEPREYAAGRLLERGEVDAVVLVGPEAVDFLSADARHRLEKLPVIAIETRAKRYSGPVVARFEVGVEGVETAGVAYRMDDVPIPLRDVFASQRSASASGDELSARSATSVLTDFVARLAV